MSNCLQELDIFRLESIIISRSKYFCLKTLNVFPLLTSVSILVLCFLSWLLSCRFGFVSVFFIFELYLLYFWLNQKHGYWRIFAARHNNLLWSEICQLSCYMSNWKNDIVATTSTIHRYDKYAAFCWINNVWKSILLSLFRDIVMHLFCFVFAFLRQFVGGGDLRPGDASLPFMERQFINP